MNTLKGQAYPYPANSGVCASPTLGGKNIYLWGNGGTSIRPQAGTEIRSFRMKNHIERVIPGNQNMANYWYQYHGLTKAMGFTANARSPRRSSTTTASITRANGSSTVIGSKGGRVILATDARERLPTAPPPRVNRANTIAFNERSLEQPPRPKMSDRRRMPPSGSADRDTEARRRKPLERTPPNSQKPRRGVRAGGSKNARPPMRFSERTVPPIFCTSQCVNLLLFPCVAEYSVSTLTT